MSVLCPTGYLPSVPPGMSVSTREGQHLSLVLSHSGPFLHRLSSVGLSPLDGMSAGLSLPGQWLQSGAGTNDRISSTLFWTNGFQSLLTPLIQNKATCESMKHTGAYNSYLGARLSLTFVINRVKRSADSNSRWGMVWAFRGDTLVLNTTNLESVGH